jgi:hypothetical protein
MYLQTVGKTAEDVRNQGIEQYGNLLRSVPSLDPTSLFIDPEEQQSAAQGWEKLREQIRSEEEMAANQLANARSIAAENAAVQRERNQSEMAAATANSQRMFGYLDSILKSQSSGRTSSPWGGTTAGGGLWNQSGGAAFNAGEKPGATQGTWPATATYTPTETPGEYKYDTGNIYGGATPDFGDYFTGTVSTAYDPVARDFSVGDTEADYWNTISEDELSLYY